MSESAKTGAESDPSVQIPAGEVRLHGDLVVPRGATGVVLFAHGSGSSRHSPRNRFVAETIRGARIGTLLFDLLTVEEEAVDAVTRQLRFNIPLLASRLIAAAQWIRTEMGGVDLGFFGASTGGGAALVAAAALGKNVKAVVSRGGRPDLADASLPEVTAPTLLIVGARDEPVIQMNEWALERLKCEKELLIVPGATHLFQEPGTLNAVARAAADWFRKHLNG